MKELYDYKNCDTYMNIYEKSKHSSSKYLIDFMKSIFMVVKNLNIYNLTFYYNNEKLNESNINCYINKKDLINLNLRIQYRK